MAGNNKELKTAFILAFVLIFSFAVSSCTHSSSGVNVKKAYFEFSDSNATANVNENFTGWWKVYTPKNSPQYAIIETFSRKNSNKIAIDTLLIPKGYEAKATNYTYKSNISAFYTDNASFECCKPSFNVSGTYYVDLYLYNCSTLNDYFINSCRTLSDYAKNIIAAKPKGLHQRMQITVS